MLGLLLLASLVLLRESWRIDGLPSPSAAGVTPTVASALMAACAAFLLLRRVVAGAPERVVPVDTLRRLVATVLPARVVGTALLLLLYMLALEPLGFVVSSLLFLVLSMLLLGWRRPVPLLLAAGGTVAAIRLVFATLFEVQLP